MDDKTVQKLRERIVSNTALGAPVFEIRWRTVLEDFKKWESSPIGQAASALTAQLELLRRLCETFPEDDLRSDEEILRVCLKIQIT